MSQITRDTIIGYSICSIYHTIFYCVVSCRIVLHQIISYPSYIISYIIISHRIASHHRIASYHVTSHHITSPHHITTSFHIISSYISFVKIIYCEIKTFSIRNVPIFSCKWPTEICKQGWCLCNGIWSSDALNRVYSCILRWPLHKLSRLPDAYMRHWIMPPLVQIMCCRLFGVKQFFEPMLMYYQFDL